MRVCFIGSNGFMAKAFGKFYESQKDIELSVFGRTKPEYPYHKFEQLNLTASHIDFSFLNSYDLIYYFAGEGVQSNKKSSNVDILKVNCFVPIMILSILDSLNYNGKLVTFGSYAEIGFNNEYLPFNEKSIIQSSSKAPNCYTASKRLLTKYIDSQKFSFNLLHFIIPTIYGKGENPNRIIPYIVNCAKNNEPIKLTSGHQIREYLHISELPIIVDKSLSEKLESGIYNVAGSEVVKIRDLVHFLAKELKINEELIKFEEMERWDTGMNVLILDGSKLTKSINYIASKKIKSVLTEYF